MMTGGSKIRGVQLLITEFRDVEERNVQIMHKLSSVFMSMIKSDDDIELSEEEYGIRIVKTVSQENYNNDIYEWGKETLWWGRRVAACKAKIKNVGRSSNFLDAKIDTINLFDKR